MTSVLQSGCWNTRLKQRFLATPNQETWLHSVLKTVGLPNHKPFLASCLIDEKQTDWETNQWLSHKTICVAISKCKLSTSQVNKKDFTHSNCSSWVFFFIWWMNERYEWAYDRNGFEGGELVLGCAVSCLLGAIAELPGWWGRRVSVSEYLYLRNYKVEWAKWRYHFLFQLCPCRNGGKQV